MRKLPSTSRVSVALILAPVICASLCGCPRKESADKPLAPFQVKLLDLAFDTATAIPSNPHIKDRSRAQEAVVVASFELDQPKRVKGYVEKIDNWIKGACYADLAFYCAQRGYAGEARQCIEKASKISESAEDWRKDRINFKIRRTETMLDQKKTNEVPTVDQTAFDKEIRRLGDAVGTGEFEATRAALEAYIQLFNRCYDDAGRRSLIEEKIKAAWSKQPVFVRMNLLMELAGFALERADHTKALQLVNETQQLMDDSQWAPEDRLPLAAKLAALRFRAADTAKARSDADSALSFYNSNQKQIVDIWRADALRPLAMAYQEMGDSKSALAVYKLAVKEGIENPNSRPRAEDLAATCSSMALSGVEPDAELWAEINRIRGGLGKPW